MDDKIIGFTNKKCNGVIDPDYVAKVFPRKHFLWRTKDTKIVYYSKAYNSINSPCRLSLSLIRETRLSGDIT